MLQLHASQWLKRAAMLLLMGAAACGASDVAVNCMPMPQSCGAGMTCWPTDMGGEFQCLGSKPYAPLGTECAILVGLTTCADSLICAPMTGQNGAKTNRCTQYCGDGAACPAGATCTPISLFAISPQISVCILPPPT
jgi:hypothetical protein